jgi:hypothetical protein
MEDAGLRRRIMCALAILVLFTVSMILVQVLATSGAEALNAGAVTVMGRKAEFTRDDFRYGPQSWRPYNVPLAIENSSSAEWYFMFVRLNESPYGGNPLLYPTRRLKVSYRFSNLSGTAAFHVYGLREWTDQYLTNRQDGYGACALYVSGNASGAGRMPETTVLPAANRVAVVIANPPEGAGYSLNDTYVLKFDRGPTSGLDAIHILPDLTPGKGQVIRRTGEEGEFYITHTGGSRVGALLLMIAVDRGQPGDFALAVRSWLVEGR